MPNSGISQRDLLKVASFAWHELESYLAAKSLEAPNVMLGRGERGMESNSLFHAGSFAEHVTHRTVQRFRREIPEGFGSWLVMTPTPQVALNAGQLERWADGDAYRLYTIESRCVYHEIGHYVMHKHLLAAPAMVGLHALAPWSFPEDEKEAWIFAQTVTGIMLADYACSQRKSRQIDDSPQILV